MNELDSLVPLKHKEYDVNQEGYALVNLEPDLIDAASEEAFGTGIRAALPTQGQRLGPLRSPYAGGSN